MVTLCLQHKYIGGILPIAPAGKGMSRGKEKYVCLFQWELNLKQKNIQHHGPKPIPNICQLPDIPTFSLVHTFKKQEKKDPSLPSSQLLTEVAENCTKYWLVHSNISHLIIF
jgi:hypothetical protein